MENKQLIKWKESFITKLRNLFKKLFKNNNQYIHEKENTNKISNKTDEKNFLSDIKVDSTIVDKELKKRSFLEKINGNEELLSELSIDRLRRLERYYADVIKENEKKIIKRKRKYDIEQSIMNEY